MENILEVSGLTKLYRNGRGIRDINFVIQRGDIFGFLGPNGAGKTSVMKIITGLIKPDSGQVKIFGCDIATRFAEAMSRVGCLVETADAYQYLSAEQNLKLAARFYPEVNRSRIDEVLETVGLSKYKQEKTAGYSLGMRQRLGLALAMLSRPELIILDEPVNGLDIEGMIEIRKTIARLAAEQQVTFFISSHLIHEIELVCNKIGIIIDGELIRKGEVRELAGEFNSLEDYYVSQLKAKREGTGNGCAEREYCQ